MARLSQDEKIQPHWWRKSLIGFFMGLSFTYALVAWFGPGGIDGPMKLQFNMWIISPISLSIMCFIFLFEKLLLLLEHYLSQILLHTHYF